MVHTDTIKQSCPMKYIHINGIKRVKAKILKANSILNMKLKENSLIERNQRNK